MHMARIPVLAFILLAGSLVAQVAPSKPAPRLKFEEQEFDFGKLKTEAKVTHVFKFRNVAEAATVEIKGVQASCGCTTTELSKKSFAPGETGEISATFDPRMRQGKERKVITVTTDDPAAEKMELVLLVEVIPQIIIEPLAAYLGEARFDEVAKATPPLKKTIQISIRGEVCKVKGVSIDDKRVELRNLGTGPAEVDGEKVERTTFEVALEKNTTIGRIQTQVVVETTDVNRPKLYIPIIMDIVGELRFYEYPWYLRMTGAGQAVSQVFQVGSRTMKPFKVLSATVDGGDKMPLTIAFEPAPDTNNTTWKFTLKGTAPAGGTAIAGKVTFKTDIDIQPDVEIPVSGFVPMAQPTAGGH